MWHLKEKEFASKNGIFILNKNLFLIGENIEKKDLKNQIF